MERVFLTDSKQIYGEVSVLDEKELVALNAPLCAAPLLAAAASSNAVSWLEWRVADACQGLPQATLQQRARVAFEVACARTAHQARERRRLEIARQRAELRRLLLHCLQEECPKSALQVSALPVSALQVDDTQAPDFEDVRVVNNVIFGAARHEESCVEPCEEPCRCHQQCSKAPCRCVERYGQDVPESLVMVEIDSLTFRVRPLSNRNYVLQVALTCHECLDCNWFSIASLEALGQLLSHLLERATLWCPTCLQLDADPFYRE